MHLSRENTRMQIRWATGSLLGPSDDFFGFFLVWRTWKEIWWNGCQCFEMYVSMTLVLLFSECCPTYIPSRIGLLQRLGKQIKYLLPAIPLALLILVLIQFLSVHFSSPWLKVPQTFVFPISAKYIQSSLDRHHHWLTTALWENGTKNFNYCERNVHSACLQLGRYLD